MSKKAMTVGVEKTTCAGSSLDGSAFDGEVGGGSLLKSEPGGKASEMAQNGQSSALPPGLSDMTNERASACRALVSVETPLDATAPHTDTGRRWLHVGDRRVAIPR